MDAIQPVQSPLPTHVAKAKPDARPMRMALFAGGVATLSALVAAIVSPPGPAATRAIAPLQPPVSRDPTAGPTVSPTDVQVVRPIRYVQLSPGQTAPPGATVIDASAPTPITVVVNVPAPAQRVSGGGGAAAAPTAVIIKTTQSGQIVP
jgi:hypothetical protein